MTLIKRSELLSRFLEEPVAFKSQVFLFFGERYLCREAADLTQEKLLASTPGAIHNIDGDGEDPSQTLARLMSFSLLPGRQLYRVSNSRIFHSKTVVAEIWAKDLVSGRELIRQAVTLF